MAIGDHLLATFDVFRCETKMAVFSRQSKFAVSAQSAET
jgi:hypothetical protein